jgi:hypothetical protein
VNDTEKPTHAARTPEEYRILLLERQVDHLISFVASGMGREFDVLELVDRYQDQRREFQLPSERQSGEPGLDIDDVLREAENALQQAGLAINPHTVSTATIPMVESIVTRAQLKVRQLLAERGVTE